MKCRKIQKRLSAYQDGELRPVEQDRIKIHLEDCQECRKQYSELKRIWHLLGEWPDIHPSSGFHLQVLGKISVLKGANFIPRLRQVFKLLPSPLAMVTLLLVGLVTGTYLGKLLFEDSLSPSQGSQPSYAQEHVSLASIRSFDTVPPGTLAHGYLAMASHEQEAQ
jgi:anti-sigma factor RsiW